MATHPVFQSLLDDPTLSDFFDHFPSELTTTQGWGTDGGPTLGETSGCDEIGYAIAAFAIDTGEPDWYFLFRESIYLNSSSFDGTLIATAGVAGVGSVSLTADKDGTIHLIEDFSAVVHDSAPGAVAVDGSQSAFQFRVDVSNPAQATIKIYVNDVLKMTAVVVYVGGFGPFAGDMYLVTYAGVDTGTILAPSFFKVDDVAFTGSFLPGFAIKLEDPALTSYCNFTPEAQFEDGQVSAPLTWLEFTDKLGALNVFAEVDLNDPPSYYGGFKTAKVIHFDPISRGISDRSGQIEHQSFGALMSDTDRYFRALLDDSNNRYLTNRPLVERMIDDEMRRIQGLPRIAANGFVVDYSPRTPLQFQINGSDWLKRKFSRKARSQEAWQPIIDTDDFADAPQASQNVGVPIVYGSNSDLSAADVLTVPQNVVATVIGSGGSLISRRYGLTALRQQNSDPTDQNGETDPVWIDVPGCPDDQEFDASNYVQITCDPQAAAGCYKVYGHLPGVIGLLQNGGIDPAAPVFQDGVNGLINPDLSNTPPAANNTTPADAGRGAIPVLYVGTDLSIGAVPMKIFVVARHAVKAITGVFLDGVRVPDSRFNTSEFLAPRFPNWPLATPYFEVNDHRYTVIYVNSQLVDADSPQRLRVNVDGVETVGDGSGELIETLPQQCRHFVVNYLAEETPPGGNWIRNCATFPTTPSLALVDEGSFKNVEGVIFDRTSGGRYVGAGIIGVNGEFVSAIDVLARFNVSGDFEGYFNRKGQYAITMEPTEGTDHVDGTIDDVINISADRFTITDEVTSNFFNVHPYAYAQDYSGLLPGGWKTDIVKDFDSIENYEQEIAIPSRWEFYFLRTDTDEQAATLVDVIAHKRARFANPRRRTTLTLPFSGLDFEIGNILLVTHNDGIGSSGWNIHKLRVVRHVARLTEGQVDLECYDIAPDPS